MIKLCPRVSCFVLALFFLFGDCMDNLLPAFRPPAPTKSVPVTAIIQKHVAKYPSVVAELRKKETAAKMAYLKDRPVEKEVFLNGWPLDAPHLRHTVLFHGAYPDRSEDKTLSLGGDSSLPLLMDETESTHKLLDDPARSVRVFLCATRLLHGFEMHVMM